ncbi:MAG: BamA/TamA family outer membrane protein [Melioribacter sp.]|nr:BamA/TamA family outer membrane protein [Melioribacter sp.]
MFLLFSTFIFAQQKDTLRLKLIEKDLPFGLTKKIPENLPKVGLALSGGGARAISQIGILKALEEKNIPIEFIVGTSMGSIIGGLYSSGYSIEEIDSIVSNTNWGDFFTIEQTNRNELFVDQKITQDKAIVSFRLEGLKPILPKSILSGQRGAHFLNLLSLSAPIKPKNSFDELLFQFRAIATDLSTGKKVIIDKPPLSLAIQASSSVTLLLPPVIKGNYNLVDGGLVANIPVKETKMLGAEIVIAANAVSPLYHESELNYPWVIADQLVSIPMQILNEQQLELADFIIQPDLEGRKNTDFKNLSEIINKGYNKAQEIVPNIEKEFEAQFKNKLKSEEKFFTNVFFEHSDSIVNSVINKKYLNLISSKELLYKLYLIQRTGNYKDLYWEIKTEPETTFIKLITVNNSPIESYELKGDSILTAENFTYILNPLLGKPYNPDSVLSALLKILKLYRSKGLIFAQINKVYYEENSNKLIIEINEGKIDTITTEGNIKTNEKVITREFPLKKGDYFNYNDAKQGLTNLRSTNLFEQVELLTENNNGKNHVHIRLIEKPASIVRLGFRIDNENYSQASVDIRNENFNGTGTEIGAIFSGGIRTRSYIFEHKANRVFDTYLTYKVRAFYEFNDVNIYKDDSTAVFNRFIRNKVGEYRQIFYGGSFGIGTQVQRFGNLLIEARFQQDQIKNKSNYHLLTYKSIISALRFTLAIDSQNDYPYPTEGFLVKTFYETAQTALGGDVGYTKFYFDYKNTFSIFKKHTLIFRGVLGFADNTLPLSQQFSLGGQSSFFGMREYEYRGRQIFLSSLGYRYKLPVKLFFTTYISLRYDIGSIWSQKEEIRFKDLRHGFGGTISFQTPIGPADFSFGKSFFIKNTLPKNIVVWGPTFFYFTIGYYY